MPSPRTIFRRLAVEAAGSRPRAAHAAQFQGPLTSLVDVYETRRFVAEGEDRSRVVSRGPKEAVKEDLPFPLETAFSEGLAWAFPVQNTRPG